jgi:hypothetical protein
LPGTFTSTHSTGTLTFHFTSDGSVTGRGWDAEVTCVSESCPTPANTTVSNIEGNQATINWEAGGTENNWEIEYGLLNFTPGNGTLIEASNNTHTLPDLTPGNTYSYYLRAICGNSPGEDDSQWIGPFIFTTSCDVIVAPFYENFSQFSTPTCWSESGSEPWNFNVNADYEAATAGDNTPSGATNYAWIDGSYPNGENQISNLRTPWIDIANLSEPAISFSLFSFNTSDNTYNTFKVFIHDDTGFSSELLMVQESTEGWKIYNFNLSNLGISDKVQIEFVVQENSPGSPYFNDILIDEIKVDEESVLGITTNNISNFNYYPNPVKNSLTIQSNEQITLVLIYNVLGQKVYSLKPKSVFKIDVDVSKLPKGTYLVKAFSNEKVQNFKIIKDSD